jgi:hypothetical protein
MRVQHIRLRYQRRNKRPHRPLLPAVLDYHREVRRLAVPLCFHQNLLPALTEVSQIFGSCSITPLLFQNAILPKDLGVKPKDAGSKFADFEAKSGDDGVSFGKNLVKKCEIKMSGG